MYCFCRQIIIAFVVVIKYYRSDVHIVHNWIVIAALTGAYSTIAYQTGAVHKLLRIFGCKRQRASVFMEDTETSDEINTRETRVGFTLCERMCANLKYALLMTYCVVNRPQLP